MNSQHVTSGKRGRRKPALDPHINRYKANIGAPFYCYVCGRTHRNITWDIITKCLYRVIVPDTFEKTKYRPYLFLARNNKDGHIMRLYPQTNLLTILKSIGFNFKGNMDDILSRSKICDEGISITINAPNILAVPNKQKELSKIQKDMVLAVEDYLKRLKEELSDIIRELKCQT